MKFRFFRDSPVGPLRSFFASLWLDRCFPRLAPPWIQQYVEQLDRYAVAMVALEVMAYGQSLKS